MFEVLIIMKFLLTKPQMKSLSISYYDLYHTIITTRDYKENVNDDC